MDIAVYHGDDRVGTLSISTEGLFFGISCKLSKIPEQIGRIYVGYEWETKYLGIPDAKGSLMTRIPRKYFPNGIAFAVWSEQPRCEWSPWRGELDGVPISEAYINRTEDGIDFLLPPEEAIKLPAWAENMQTETVFGRELYSFRLLPDGTLPYITKDIGEDTDEEITGNDSADRMFDDDAADFRFSDEGRQIDRADL